MPETDIQNKAKDAAGKTAAALIEDGMTVGIGGGSTVQLFVQHLAKRCQEGLRIQAITASPDAARIAKEANIPLMDPESVSILDIAIDGADEIDPEKRMIKGGGGHLLREKIVLSAAEKLLIIVGEKKCVPLLGSFPLPVEISPFCYLATLRNLMNAGLHPKMRQTKEGLYLTTNGNYIADLHLEKKISDPAALDIELKKIPGVLETGLFLNFHPTVIIGYDDGRTSTIR